jgi:hypothetical protein
VNGSDQVVIHGENKSETRNLYYRVVVQPHFVAGRDGAPVHENRAAPL